jgi:hypothetical protein
MHALHRPYLPAALATTVTAAVLAIVLTLLTANTLSDVGAAPPSAAAPGPPAAVQASAARPGPSTSPFLRSPFTSLLTVPVSLPWAPDSR